MREELCQQPSRGRKGAIPEAAGFRDNPARPRDTAGKNARARIMPRGKRATSSGGEHGQFDTDTGQRAAASVHRKPRPFRPRQAGSRAPAGSRYRAGCMAHHRPRFRQDPLLAGGADQRAERGAPGLRLAVRDRHRARHGSDAGGDRRRDVHLRRCRAGLCAGCCDGQGAVALRAASRWQGESWRLLRHGEPRHRRVAGQDLRRRLRRHPVRAQCPGRQSAVAGADHRRQAARLLGDRRAAGGRLGGGDRQRRAEFDARGYVTAYDLETGKQAWRFYNRAWRSEEAFRASRTGDGREDLGS